MSPIIGHFLVKQGKKIALVALTLVAKVLEEGKAKSRSKSCLRIKP